MDRMYRNTNFKRRDYEAANIVYAVATGENGPQGAQWAPVEPKDATDLMGMQHIHTQAGVRYYGYA